jgi:hypothetical protein
MGSARGCGRLAHKGTGQNVPAQESPRTPPLHHERRPRSCAAPAPSYSSTSLVLLSRPAPVDPSRRAVVVAVPWQCRLAVVEPTHAEKVTCHAAHVMQPPLFPRLPPPQLLVVPMLPCYPCYPTVTCHNACTLTVTCHAPNVPLPAPTHIHAPYPCAQRPLLNGASRGSGYPEGSSPRGHRGCRCTAVEEPTHALRSHVMPPPLPPHPLPAPTHPAAPLCPGAPSGG